MLLGSFEADPGVVHANRELRTQANQISTYNNPSYCAAYSRTSQNLAKEGKIRTAPVLKWKFGMRRRREADIASDFHFCTLWMSLLGKQLKYKRYCSSAQTPTTWWYPTGAASCWFSSTATWGCTTAWDCCFCWIIARKLVIQDVSQSFADAAKRSLKHDTLLRHNYCIYSHTCPPNHKDRSVRQY